MRFEGKLRNLGPIDATALRAAALSVPASAWVEDTIRQDTFADVHMGTRSIIMLFIDLSVWPSIKVEKRRGWDYFANQTKPIIEGIISRQFRPGGVVIRAMIANLLPGALITPHIDTDPSFEVGHRIHVPLVTNDLVDFTVAGEVFNLKEGTAYELNNLEMHGVHNRSEQERLHLIFDYVSR